MTTTTYTPMTAEELAGHKAGEHGRDYSRSDDGYDDMALAESAGWHVLSSWGRDGWDLGDWPYVVVSVRTVNPGTADSDGKLTRVYQLQQVCEGDHTVYAFDSDEDRTRAIDYLFLWYAADRRWAPLKWEDRERLDRGELAVDDKWRGRPRGF
jgi:hypothetical protein